MADFDGNNIVSAVGDDGLFFEQEPGVRVDRTTPEQSYRVYAPEVVRLAAGGFRMYFAGWCAADGDASLVGGSKFHGRIYSAFSDDGLAWVPDSGTTATIDRGGKHDTAKASEPCVIELPDGSWKLFYEACDLAGQWRIASASSIPN
eukprot:SAG22_NODE_2809_length_2190_cov_3.879484_3_plen_147_part_00